jgi:hypothetical protein
MVHHACDARLLGRRRGPILLQELSTLLWRLDLFSTMHGEGGGAVSKNVRIGCRFSWRATTVDAAATVVVVVAATAAWSCGADELWCDLVFVDKVEGRK